MTVWIDLPRFAHRFFRRVLTDDATQPRNDIAAVAQRTAEHNMLFVESIRPDIVWHIEWFSKRAIRDHPNRGRGTDGERNSVIRYRAGTDVRAGAIADPGIPRDL